MDPSGSLGGKQIVFQLILTSVYSWGFAGPRGMSAGQGQRCSWVDTASWSGEHMDPWFGVHMSLDI